MLGSYVELGGRKEVTGSFKFCIAHRILLGRSSQEGEMGGTCSTYVFWYGNRKEREVGIGRNVILKWI